jgi:hypothetical protein
MGFIGYFVKLIHIPMYVLPLFQRPCLLGADLLVARSAGSNNILVYVEPSFLRPNIRTDEIVIAVEHEDLACAMYKSSRSFNVVYIARLSI